MTPRSNQPARETDSTAQHRSRGAIILLYHRVIELSGDPQRLCVHPRNFRRHLEILRREFRPISLRELCSCHSMGSVPDRAVAVTFDDGYTDNAQIAVPMLQEFDISATIFVTTGNIGSVREFWWDALERILLRTPHLPASLSLKVGGQRHTWRLDDGSADRPSDPSWHVESDQPLTKRQGLYRLLCRVLRDMHARKQNDVLTALFRWARVSPAAPATHRAMTIELLRRVSREGLIEIGSHTMTHPVLSKQPPRQQYEEIAASGERLSRIIGRPVTSFAYPYGCTRDFSRQTIDLVRSAGYLRAFANTGRSPDASARITADSPRFALPRAIVRDWDAPTFARYLHRAFRDSTRIESPRHATAGA